ncbi:hypothetical protein HH212_08510 [Massilia forsythiae]|uniref:Uncharacterized protein n=1 Tax=Massilia forsythiae TaxID=2728020 RepID=A0A7Z2VW64_9BURK|nr:hypothetical protein [Massilia forsythiae]QJE00065.1 hypothetical protein HH212_08510 [Massilia forsythiae]
MHHGLSSATVPGAGADIAAGCAPCDTAGGRRQARRVAGAVAASLALHAALLALVRQPQPAAPPAAAIEALTVRLQPAAPPAAAGQAAAASVEPAARSVTRSAPAAPRTPPAETTSAGAPSSATARTPPPDTGAAPRVRPAPPLIAVTPAARQAPASGFTVAPAVPAGRADDSAAANDGAAPPRFDLEAARATARKLAGEPDPSRAGTALERLPQKPLETESRLARGIAGARRADCKDGVPGGLLAPLYLMMDKKDSGCKW